MQKMSPIPPFAIALDIHAGRIPVHWTARDHQVEEVRDVEGRVLTKGGTERVFWPEVETTKSGDTAMQEIEDPSDFRAALFHALNTKWSESAALSILNRVGAWQIWTEDGGEREWQKGGFARIAYRHRSEIMVRVLPVELESMQRSTQYWYDLLSSPDKPKDARLKAALRQPPRADATPAELHFFALDAKFTNTLPVSLEWGGWGPRAVIETICASELLVAAAWADAAGGITSQVCQRCLTRFSSPRTKKYCRGECGHAEAVMNYKRRIANRAPSDSQKVQQASPTKKSISEYV